MRSLAAHALRFVGLTDTQAAPAHQDFVVQADTDTIAGQMAAQAACSNPSVKSYCNVSYYVFVTYRLRMENNKKKGVLYLIFIYL